MGQNPISYCHTNAMETYLIIFFLLNKFKKYNKSVVGLDSFLTKENIHMYSANDFVGYSL